MRNVAVVGGGQIFETVHLKAIERTPEIQEIHVVETNDSRRDELSQLYPKLILHDNIDAMLETSTISDAIVCVPNKFHHQVTIKLLNAKINVFCEKPPAISSAEAYEMYECANNNQVKLFYNFHLRQLPSLGALRKNLQDVYSIDIKALRRRGIPGWGSFTNKEIQGGGALMDLGIHYLDLVLSLTDTYEFDSIHAITDDYIGKNESTGDFGDWDNTKFTVENFCSASLKAKYMLTLNTAFAHNIADKDQYDITIYKHSGRIELLKQQEFDTSNNLIYKADEEIDQGQLRIESSFQFMSRQYHNLCDGLNGYRIQEIIEKIYESAGDKNE